MTQRNRSRARGTRKGSTRRASPSPRAARKPDALRMLKDDHQRVQVLFGRFERARGDDQKEAVATAICNELKVHAHLEEEIFYPAVRDAIGDDDLMNEADVEHATAKDLIGQIESSSPSDERYDALVTVLGEYIKHHVKEEEGEMFKKARRSGLDLATLGGEMKAAKKTIKSPPGAVSGLLDRLASRAS